MLNYLSKWSYLISIFSFDFDKNYVPQLVEKLIHFSEENASEQYLVRGGKGLEIKVLIHQFDRLQVVTGYLLVEHLLRGGLLVGSSVLLSSDIELQEVNSGG